jgi:DNA-binding NarL/FixJ family response regulator
LEGVFTGEEFDADMRARIEAARKSSVRNQAGTVVMKTTKGGNPLARIRRVSGLHSETIDTLKAVEEKELLTVREWETMLLLAQGLTNSKIAERLVIDLETVKTHIKHALAKTKCKNRTQLAAYAVYRYFG